MRGRRNDRKGEEGGEKMIQNTNFSKKKEKREKEKKEDEVRREKEIQKADERQRKGKER